MALWCSNIGNKNGQILTSVLTSGGQGLIPMLVGVINRYTKAQVSSSEIIRIHDECEIVRSISVRQHKASFDDYSTVGHMAIYEEDCNWLLDRIISIVLLVLLVQKRRSRTGSRTSESAMVVSSSTGSSSQQHTWSEQVFCSAPGSLDATKAVESDTVLP